MTSPTDNPEPAPDPNPAGLRCRPSASTADPPSIHDIEIGLSTSTPAIFDPLHLISLKQAPTEISKQVKKVQKFYTAQNALIDMLTAPLEDESSSADMEISSRRKQDIAIYGSLLANVLLASLQLIAALYSGSLAIFATMADAFMDLLSGGIILAANRMSKSSSEMRYPTGKSRFETVGIIIFGTLMSTVSLQIIINSVSRIISDNEKPDLGVVSISLIGTAILIKFCLFLYCRLIPEQSVQVLAQDHRNDILLNGVGVCMGILADKLDTPVLDPVGAIFVALVMFRSWTKTILDQGQLISGKAAGPNFLKRVTYLAMTHDDRIIHVESARAYHAGAKIIVEVDIVLPPDMTLQVAHDLGEDLQGKLESIGVVERAFVHCDYNYTHEPEHQRKKEL
ncbi:Metal tolerance protein 9 [Folsomia candida]|uniref:Metal tolerance protein 9 n=2 Tax=Folsomia candida TaxID=158441 RepID=A0A226E1H1_FOLCA|nr:Metal tolerance protein 9 [Folsomia candida]